MAFVTEDRLALLRDSGFLVEREDEEDRDDDEEDWKDD